MGVALRACFALVLVTGCESLDGLSENESPSHAHVPSAPSTSAPASAAPKCDATSPFTSARSVEAPPGASIFSARWNAAKTQVVFNQGSGDAVELRLGISIADATSEPFAAIVPHSTPTQTMTLYFPTLSSDGLVLFYQQFTSTPDGFGQSDIFRARRASTTHAFHDPEPAFPKSTMDFAPYLVGEALYYTHSDTNNGSAHVMRWALDATSDPEEVFVSSSSAVSVTVVSDDELTLYYGDMRGGTFDVFVATRTSTKARFGEGRRMDSLSTSTYDEVPSWISADQCELVYEKRDPQADTHSLWSATRTP
jgi:hypothetical protein